tara:strand:+ start:284 stop:502 length:219 start_codon:yes stop_codon:yes gene_type:complete
MPHIFTPKLSVIFKLGMSGQLENTVLLEHKTKMMIAGKYLIFIIITFRKRIIIMLQDLMEYANVTAQIRGIY